MKPLLKNITVENFRGFSGTTTIDLNADVVLVHGLNGSGKTTLLHAIELALTGNIGDLVRFETDYPRCLLSEGSTALSVVLQALQSEETYQYHQGREATGLFNLQLDRTLQQHFTERCYLSQLKLSRLLDIYQESEESRIGGEQRIIRFVRELLGLSRLQCVNEGLAIARHATTFKTEVPSVRRLQERKEALERQHDELEPRAKLLDNNLKSVMGTISGDVRKQVGLPTKVPTEVNSLKSELDTISGYIRAAKKDVRDAEKNLDILSELEEDYRIHAAAPSEADVEKVISDLQKERDRKISVISKAIDSANTGLSTIAKVIEDKEWRPLTTGNALFNRHGDLEELMDRTIANLRRELGELSVDEKRHQVLSKDIKNFEQTYKSLVPVSDKVTHADEYVEALTLLLQVVHGNDCPVCGRDFAELGAKRNLRSHIAEQIKRLGTDAEKAAKALEQQIQVQSQQKKKLTEWRMLDKAAANRAKRISAIDKELDQIGKLTEKLETLEGAIQAILRHEDDLRDIKDRLQKLQAASKGIERISAKLLLIEKDSGLTTEVDAPVNIKRIARCVTSVRTKLRDYQVLSDHLDALHEKIADAQKYVEARNILAVRVRELALELEVVGKALKSVDRVRREAKKLAETAEEVRNDLLSTTLSTSLASLWRDLYVRIVKDEVFAPNIGPISVDYRVTNTSLQAVGPAGVPYQYLLSVLSSGNANTAALCLFLALNLIQTSLFPVLLLDDPVQNMDDVHLVQLASVLRAIKRDAGRQLIVAVHERSLFDYLTVELAPSKPGESLLGVELTKEDGAIRARTSRTQWVPDKIRIADVSARSA